MTLANPIAGALPESASVSLKFPGDDSYNNPVAVPDTIATLAPAATPEPSAFVLLGTGLVGGAASLLRRRFIQQV